MIFRINVCIFQIKGNKLFQNDDSTLDRNSIKLIRLYEKCLVELLNSIRSDDCSPELDAWDEETHIFITEILPIYYLDHREDMLNVFSYYKIL